MTKPQDVYRFNRDAAKERARAAIRVEADWLAVVAQLAAWMTWLDEQPLTTNRRDQILEALASDDRSFGAWCTANGHEIPAALQSLLALTGDDDQRKTLSAEGAFLLGWCAAVSFFDRLSESRGFSAPYEMVGMLDAFGVGYAGVGDALQLASDSIWTAVKQEILEGLKSSIAGAVDEVPTHFAPLDSAMLVWRSARDAEQALNRSVLEVPIPSVLHQVLADAGRRDLNFYVKALDSTAGPWVTWPCLLHANHSIEHLLELLRRVESCYQADGSWNGKWTARLLAHLVESNLLSTVTRAEPTDIRAGLQAASDTISAAVGALSATPGGRILLIRWLAHLIVETASTETSVFRQKQVADRQTFYYAVMNAVVDTVGDATWSKPAQVRAAFPTTAAGEQSGSPSLPIWIDDRGREDHAVPLACAAALQMYEGAQQQSFPEIDPWFTEVSASLRGKPAAYFLSSETANILTRFVAWPLFVADHSRELLEDVWQRLALARIESSYSRDADASQATEHCAAIANVALEALSWRMGSDVGEIVESDYASRVADIVDELRYLIPTVGLKSWSTTVGRLASVMAAIGWFKDFNLLTAHLARYVGDVDALAVAMASTIANGISSAEVSRALVAIGVNPSETTRDYRDWVKSSARRMTGNQALSILEDAYGTG
jgi:hypothetical protein